MAVRSGATPTSTATSWPSPAHRGPRSATPSATTPTATRSRAGLPDNSESDYDYGWLGKHQRGLEHRGTIATIEMGARQYVPALGRFLQVDPIEEGSANDYEYVNGDPINNLDLTGLASEKALSNAEQWALWHKSFGEPYDRKAYNRARQKLKHNEKVRRERNRQKRQSNFSLPPLPNWVPGGVVGGAIVGCILFCIPTPWPIL